MFEMDWSQLSCLMPIWVVLAAALVVVFLDLVISHKDRYVLSWIAFSGAVLGLLSTGQTLAVLSKQTIWFLNYSSKLHHSQSLPLILGGAFCVDGFGMLIWGIACLAGALSILCVPEQNEDAALSSGEYYGLTLLAVAGMMLLAVSHDWMTLLISLEIMSISTYILTGSNRENSRSNEAALKYLVLGAFSTAFMLMGMAFYYGATGNVSLSPSHVLQQMNGQEAFMFLGMGLIFVGAMFKVGASPFHFWIPDVYEGAPTPITGLMAVGVKAAAFAVVGRLTFETFGATDLRVNWIEIIRVLAVLTMAVGNILAMRQSNLKRMLAYSGIAHTGYLLLAFLVRPDHATDTAAMNEHLKAVVFYLLTYGVMTLGAFGVIGLMREDGKPLEEMENYTGLAKEHPGIAFCMAMFMLSLAGMPPMGGFFAKFLIFQGAIAEGESVAAVLGILTSVASLYYYLRVVVAMYMSPSNASSPAPTPGEPALAARCHYAWASSLLIYAAGVATLIIGLLPGLVSALLFY